MIYFKLWENDNYYLTKNLTQLYIKLNLIPIERALRDTKKDKLAYVYHEGKKYRLEKFKSDIEIQEGFYIDELLQEEEQSEECYKALLFGDLHFKYEDKDSVNILMQFIEKHKDEISEIVDGGDGVDASSLSKYVNTEEDKYDLYEEMEAYSDFMTGIKDLIPKAKYSILECNHYYLRLRQFISQNPAMKNMIKEIKFKFDEKAPHGKPYFPLSQYGQDKIGGIHGIVFNDNFTKKNTTSYSHDLFQFHTHTIQMYKGVNGLVSFGLPCMCKKEMAYMMGRPTRWQNGFAILTWFPKQERYTLEYCLINNGIGIYRDKAYVSKVGD